jgi:hypothetical protein
MRALLNSRSGIQRIDNAVYYLIPRVVQMGLLATIWAISGLVAFIFEPRFCSLFDMTAGAIYTHVSGSSLRIVPLDMRRRPGDIRYAPVAPQIA